MLTLLRVRRAARLRRQPELDAASCPLRSAGSWQPSFCECKAFFLRASGCIGKGRAMRCRIRQQRLDQSAMLPERQTTNLGGVRISPGAASRLAASTARPPVAVIMTNGARLNARVRGRNPALELDSGTCVAAKDHHTALRSEVLGKINAGYVEIVFAKLQSSKDDVAFTLHVNPSAFTSVRLQTTDWLRFLGFKENAQCQFANARHCFSKQVPEGYDLQRFATAFNEGFGQLQKAEEGLQASALGYPGHGSYRLGLRLSAKN